MRTTHVVSKGRKKCAHGFMGNLSVYLEELGVDGRIIVKCIRQG
jgi:hypothetical protein